MMIYPSVTDLIRANKVPDRYTLVIATAKRAREILSTGITFTDCNSDKPVTIALHEINENKVSFKNPDNTGASASFGTIMVGMPDDAELNELVSSENLFNN